MASTTNPQIIDDDEFDWEAAVEEIDVACQTTRQTNAQLIDKSHQISAAISCNETQRKLGGSRQSTLDKFIGTTGPRSERECRNKQYKSHNDIEGSERESTSCLSIDAEAAKTWIYPVNVPLRDYQLSISRTCLFSNTLVALPTGLGKTLIAAVVMYNYLRWFPEGKIVFAAPSRPLVMQQIEACHNVVGIPQEWTIDMTGQTSPIRRASLWKTKRVFFVTPQVLEKDIQSGSCMVRHLVCLVIDEAHRALGNYSYSVAVRELRAVPVHLRILALTATPGCKQQTVQHIIDNLQISTLEYRNESDHDVLPYVHDRRIELIQVAMGQDAVEINNVLLEVIRPYVARLNSIGVLQHRDFQTLSPCDLLNLRDKFRNAPPKDLPQMKYGEVEGYFGVLITLYHIRKLLSSHGIRPAFEMLEEKLQQGSFARFMSRNEVILKAKLLMQKSLTHGAPSPKLSRMLEILLDHFKMKDPQTSRVIIFSNFRGSVREIMEAVAKVGEFVKATEFIGQSSGKSLKGQSQKVQQAVLEKFRAGGYNVIIATSIGEEGLDIMEVDLVICFDANISPLRMIQRMGRTGRKHEGRVVVLACEGAELKGYLRKEANRKAINKHMRNGGTNSFIFHSSPRMIPHIFKPEVKYVELSIEQFIPRAKKLKDDVPMQSPVCETKLTNDEADLIAKYFQPTVVSTWRPSLIVFPCFQAFPSVVHKVAHSVRTGMLIDAMQNLQGLSCCEKSGEVSSALGLGVETSVQQDFTMTDVHSIHNCAKMDWMGERAESDVALVESCEAKDDKSMEDLQRQNSPTHACLFNSDNLSVNAHKRMIIAEPEPILLEEATHSKCTGSGKSMLLSCLDKNSLYSRFSSEEDKDMTTIKDMETTVKQRDFSSTKTSCIETPGLLYFDAQHEEEAGSQTNAQTPMSTGKFPNEVVSDDEPPKEKEIPTLLVDGLSDNPIDIELSPRLMDFISSGLVPESPVDDTDHGLPATLHPEQFLETLAPAKNQDPESDSDSENKTPLHVSKLRECTFPCPIGEEIMSLENLSNKSSSKDWHLSSGDKSASFEQEHKFRRLRKYGNLPNRGSAEQKRQNVSPSANWKKYSTTDSPVAVKYSRGGKQQFVRIFIEEEAEVSSEVLVSDDEEEQDHKSCDGGFIDDRIELTESTQAEARRSEMMTVYRRSLLSQSPTERFPNIFTRPDSLASESQISVNESTSETTSYALQTPRTGLESTSRNPASCPLDVDRISVEANPCPSNGDLKEKEGRLVRRKRKLLFHQAELSPASNAQHKSCLRSEAVDKDSTRQAELKNIDTYSNLFDDDKFYESIDLDALEEQAADLLRSKELSSHNRGTNLEAGPQNPSVRGSPSFDLQI